MRPDTTRTSPPLSTTVLSDRAPLAHCLSSLSLQYTFDLALAFNSAQLAILIDSIFHLLGDCWQ